MIREQIEVIYPKLRAVWDGANPDSIFRSWYSLLPPNRSFFVAYVLAFMVLLLLFGFVYLSVQGV